MKNIFFTLLLAMLVTGCFSKEESASQHFRMNFHSEPATLDPRLVRDIPTVTTAKLLFEGLMRLDETGTPIAAIASEVILSPDQKTYTFLLGDALWSNGAPVTAFDFEYSWKSILSPTFPAEYAHQLFIIKNAKAAKKGLLSVDAIGVHAEGHKKLIVTLEHPDPYFLELTCFPISFPVCSSVVKENPSWACLQGDLFICNGPFQLVEWRQGSGLVAKKNEAFWDSRAVKLQYVTFTMIEDEHTELNMYENNELDWAGSPNSSIPPEALPALRSHPEKKEELLVKPIAGTFCYKFNTRKAPFNSLKMRLAFSYAIDRKSLIENVLQANQLVASSLLPPCMRSDTLASCERENSSACKLFEEALKENGWTRETFPPITLIFSKSEKHQKVAQAIQQQWCDAFNIKIALQSYEWNTFLSHLAKGDFQVGGRGWISDLSDPKTLLEIYKFASEEHSNNNTGWENKKFAQLLDEAEETMDVEKRFALLKQAEEILLAEMPIAPLYHSTACYLKKPYVKGVYFSKLCDLDFKNAYIQK